MHDGERVRSESKRPARCGTKGFRNRRENGRAEAALFWNEGAGLKEALILSGGCSIGLLISGRGRRKTPQRPGRYPRDFSIFCVAG